MSTIACFFSLSIDLGIICPSSIYECWLLFWRLQTFLICFKNKLICQKRGRNWRFNYVGFDSKIYWLIIFKCQKKYFGISSFLKFFFRIIVYLTSINSTQAILYMTLYGYRLNISLCVSANSWLEEIVNVWAHNTSLTPPLLSQARKVSGHVFVC